MIPGNALSLTPQVGAFLSPDHLVTGPLLDHERGGVALNDGTQGLRIQNWKAGVDGGNLYVEDALGVRTTVLVRSNVSTVSLAFDSNMRATLAYTQAGVAKYFWFDTNVGMMVESSLPAGSVTPRLATDDKRPTQTLAVDIILAYIRAGNLYFRQQRDRYTVEYLLGPAPAPSLLNIGMNSVNRLQFELG